MRTRELTQDDLPMVRAWMLTVTVGCRPHDQADADQMLDRWVNTFHGTLIGTFEGDTLHSMRAVAVDRRTCVILALMIASADPDLYTRSFRGFMAWCASASLTIVVARLSAWDDPRSQNWAREESSVQMSRLLRAIAKNPRIEQRTVGTTTENYFVYDVAA